MRVFCPEHKRSFFAPRQSPIKCENRGHVLGELDFAGERKQFNTQSEVQWQYCCNCEHFSVIDGDHGLQRCPVCTRRSSNIFLCDRCFTMTFESITPIETKNFTLGSEGGPKPCCPGCLQPAPADLYEHTCDVATASFVTGLNVCPLCDERLDISPSFPSSVADYLRRTKSANKLYVTFDYETELFVLIEDGEFAVITNSDPSGRTFLLPRATRLNSAREFYELYQDYYHCNAPATGEMNVTEPAIVAETRDGWRFEAPGILVVVGGAEPKKIAAPVVAPRTERAIASEPRAATSEAATATPCAFCETLVEAKYAFCWKCGHPRGSKAPGPGGRPERSRVMVSTFTGEEEPEDPPQRNRSGFSRSQSWTSAFADTPSKSHGSVLKLFSIIVAGLLFGFLALFIVVRSNATATAESAQTNAPTDQVAANTTPVNVPAPTIEMEPASMETPPAAPEDQALQRLRELRSSARASDRAKVLQKFSETERKYARDYRFAYERARTVVDFKKNYRNEAFAALARAAQKAIRSGKAGEMLDSLNRDKNGDFQKLSRGHREWAQVQKALKTKDARILDVEETF